MYKRPNHQHHDCCITANICQEFQLSASATFFSLLLLLLSCCYYYYYHAIHVIVYNCCIGYCFWCVGSFFSSSNCFTIFSSLAAAIFCSLPANRRRIDETKKRFALKIHKSIMECVHENIISFVGTLLLFLGFSL